MGPTQPQHNLNLTQLSWVWHENDFAHHPTTLTQTQFPSQGASGQPLMLLK